MEIDWTRTYRVLLNNKFLGYRPTKDTLKALGYYLPKCRVVGFGQEGWLKYWYLTVYSPTFPINDYAPTTYMTWQQATKSYNTPPLLPPGNGPKAS